MASGNTPRRWRCCRATPGRARRCFPTAATRCRSPLPAASDLAARNHTPACLAIAGVLLTMRALRMARSRSRTGPASASKARPDFSASCENWRGFKPLFRTFQRCRNLDRCFGTAETNVNLQPDQQHAKENEHRTDWTLHEKKDVTPRKQQGAPESFLAAAPLPET